MKKILLPLAIILCTVVAIAQETADGANVQDPKAKAILDELSKKTKTYTSIKAEFSFMMENKEEGINETQKGKLLVKDEMYKLDIAGQVITCNGKTIWTYIKEADEVQINNISDLEEEEDALVSPTDIFTMYEKGFKYQFVKEDTQNGKTVQVIKLYPINANEKSYHTIILTIDKKKQQLLSFKILEKDGNKFTYQIETFTPNITIDDSTFNFDISKVGEVIDLRED